MSYFTDFLEIALHFDCFSTGFSPLFDRGSHFPLFDRNGVKTLGKLDFREFLKSQSRIPGFPARRPEIEF